MWPPFPQFPEGPAPPFSYILHPLHLPITSSLRHRLAPSHLHPIWRSKACLLCRGAFLKTHFENLKILHRLANQGPHGLSAFGLRAGSDLRTPHSLLLPRWQIYISFLFVFSATCGRSLRSWRQSNLRTSRLVTVFDLIIRSGTQQYNWDCRV